MIGVCFVVDYYEVPFMNNGTKKMQGLSSPASLIFISMTQRLRDYQLTQLSICHRF